ncbi:MAG: hypothetical protein KAG26_08300 [Methylococcales bacterium]|nr:hypothetical protein [Methylococcales bacterium]
MTAYINFAIENQFQKNEKLIVTPVVDEATEREKIFVAQAMKIYQDIALQEELEVGQAIDIGATIVFEDNDGKITARVVDNGRENVIGGHLSLTYTMANSIANNLSHVFGDEEEWDEYEEDCFEEVELFF